MRRNIPPPPPRPLSKRLYDLDTRNNGGKPPPHRRPSKEDDDTMSTDNNSLLAMAKRLDASSVISDPSFIEGTQPHRFGLDPGGFGESGDMYAENYYERNPYYSSGQQRDLDSIASSHDHDENSVYTDDGSRSEYTEESMERNPYRNNMPPPGVPRVGHYDEEDMYDQRSRYGPPNDYRYQGGGGRRAGDSARSRDSMNTRTSRSQSPNRMSRRDSRSQSPSRRSKGPYVKQQRGYQDAHHSNDMVDHIISERNRGIDTKKTMKLVTVPLIIVVVIAVAIGVVIGTRGDNNKNEPIGNHEIIQVALPTPMPTYKGEYHCPDGYTGPVSTKGCLGYVQCNGNGEIEGDILACPSGTLYDANLNTCSWEESVNCSTQPYVATESNTDTTIATSAATMSPTPKPVAAVPPETQTVGPTSTFNHKLSFRGVLTLGDVATFEKNIENYINIFFSPSRNNVLTEDAAILASEDQILNSLSSVKVDLTIKKFEWSRVTRLRRLQEDTELIMIYDQKTGYSTSDSAIKVGTVVRYPYEGQYEPSLIEYLKNTDDVFASLTSINFLEPGQDSGIESSITTSSTSPTISTVVAPMPSMSPSASPIAKTPPPTILIETESPTNKATSAAPTTKPTALITPQPTELTFAAFPEYATIQGYMWIDTNGDGLYQSSEPPAAGTFANLRQCADDQWIGTTQANGSGQYQFNAVELGEYYVEFFRPTDQYEFTLPMMGTDSSALDSDVTLLSGKTACVNVDSSYSQLINAGYVPIDQPEEDETITTSTELSEADTFKYCAQVTTTSGNQSFDFFGCSTRCSKDADCDGDFRCLLSKSCSKQEN